MTHADDSRHMTRAAERITGTYHCHSGKHFVSHAIPFTTRRGRRTCANCQARIKQLRKARR